MTRKILVAHPLQQHSYKTATAFAKTGDLCSYDTTIYYNSRKPMYKLLERVLSKDNVKRMLGRKSETLDEKVHTHLSWLGLFYLLVYRKDKRRKIEPHVYSILTAGFGRIISRKVKKENINILWMYDTTAKHCFVKLKMDKCSAIKVLDMSSAAAPYIRKLILDEMVRYPQYASSLQSKLNSYSVSLCKRYQIEIGTADCYIVPSQFVARSLMECGVACEKIHVVPYGVDISTFSYTSRRVEKSDCLKLLFVGRIEVAKGVHYLAEAMRRVFDLNVNLTLVGAMQEGMDHVFDGIPNVKYVGMKRRDEMPDVYHSHDVLVLPSMWEGFSQTVAEAMATGMPVLISDHTGADAIISAYQNGITFPSGDVDAIEQGIRWYAMNMDKISKMGNNAFETISKFTIAHYEERLLQVVDSIV